MITSFNVLFDVFINFMKNIFFSILSEIRKKHQTVTACNKAEKTGFHEKLAKEAFFSKSKIGNLILFS